MGLNANVEVARFDSVIFRVWDRDEKQKDSQDYYGEPTTNKAFLRNLLNELY
jgi:hypothetical protein